MNRLARAFIWLRRLPYCRGFGIQSPTDYRFVRYVINESWPYYEYDSLGKKDNGERRKLGLLYFRLANFLQPSTVADLVGYSQYISAGCRKAEVSTVSRNNAALYIAPPEESVVDALLKQIPDNAMLVVENIGKHKDIWTHVVECISATITYDLYYCGIAIFNPNRHKQHYIINF